MNQDEQRFNYLGERSYFGYLYRNCYLYPRFRKRLGGSVLDVGCGIGDFLKFMRSAVGVDINPFNVEYCRVRGLTAHLIDKPVYPFGDMSFDSAVLDNVLEHLDDPLPTVREIYRMLRRNGTLIVSVPGRRGFGRDEDHRRFYDEASLVDLLEKSNFVAKEIFHSPFKSALLDKYARMYCVNVVVKRN